MLSYPLSFTPTKRWQDKEIAKTLDISEKTVENQIVKALKLLRAYLGPYLSIILPILIIIL